MIDRNGAGEGIDNYFTLSFTYEFEAHTDDEVWFSHAIPWTYSEMNEKLLNIKANSNFNEFISTELLCLSLGKLPVPLVTITD